MKPVIVRVWAVVAVLAFVLACNMPFAGSSLGAAPTPTVLAPTLIQPTVTLAAPALTPAYIPPGCENIALATVSPSALATPTPVLQANPPISTETQLQVFDQMVDLVNTHYVDPDFNGVDWTGITARHREQISAGMDTEAFYADLQAMIDELGDEHSYFESPVQVALSQAQLAGSIGYVGVGLYVQPLVEQERAVILGVFPDSPAQAAGLQAHDSILAVDGLPLVDSGQSYSYRLRGPECSAVTLTVQSPGQLPRDLLLVRHRISSPLPVDVRLVPTTDGPRIGYVMLPTFFDETIPGRVGEALASFGPLDALILDNRMNGGGSSTVLEPVLAYFTNGTLGAFTSRNGSRPLTITANPIHNSQTVPLVVLVSEYSVSFGEVFAGVLQDSGRAAVVGQPTLGNVEVLSSYSLDDGSKLWIAQETFIPAVSRADWEATGIIPQVEVVAGWDTFTFETDPAIAAALSLLGHR
jgi:C-terminal peptidase prc